MELAKAEEDSGRIRRASRVGEKTALQRHARRRRGDVVEERAAREHAVGAEEPPVYAFRLRARIGHAREQEASVVAVERVVVLGVAAMEGLGADDLAEVHQHGTVSAEILLVSEGNEMYAFEVQKDPPALVVL